MPRRLMASGAGALVTLALAGCAPQPEVPVPGTWGSEEGVVVELRGNGTAVLTQVPYETGAGCEEQLLGRVDGDGEWRTMGVDQIEVEFDGGSVMLWADWGGFSNVQWYKVSLDPCPATHEIEVRYMLLNP